MKSRNGITLTSLAIYITVVLIVVGILAVITGNLQSNIKEIYSEGTNNSEIDKFNVYFLKEVKKQGNGISVISQNEILFRTGSRYNFKEDNSIYLNDSIKIAENIEKCEFSSELENEKTVITVKIKAINAEEKTISYVLSNEEVVGDLEDETNYTNYIPKNWDVSKLNSETPVKFEVIDNEVNLAPIPKGFEISTETGENTISGGLVISDENENEFVWIPVENASSYTEESFGPLTANDSTSGYKYDSQDELDFYYGENHYDYLDFTYLIDQGNVQSSIRKYEGFYVGRYETTYDSVNENDVPQGIGVKQGKYVLKASNILKAGTNTTSGESYYYRWWGLYKVHKDIYANNANVQSLMISNKQWDTIMEFTEYGSAIRGTETYTTKPDKSGVSYKTDSNQYDEKNNIYDLAGNLYEWTINANSSSYRTLRGGYCSNNTNTALYSSRNVPYRKDSVCGSRITLYIK